MVPNPSKTKHNITLNTTDTMDIIAASSSSLTTKSTTPPPKIHNPHCMDFSIRTSDTIDAEQVLDGMNSLKQGGKINFEFTATDAGCKFSNIKLLLPQQGSACFSLNNVIFSFGETRQVAPEDLEPATLGHSTPTTSEI